VLVVVVFGLSGLSRAAAAEPGVTFESDVLPLLERYCFDCHGPDKHKGDVNLSSYPDEASVLRDPKAWQNVLRQVHERQMPPQKKPQPTPAERERLTDWIRQALDSLDSGTLPPDPGRVTIRRLNRVEYNNTVRDLLGVDLKPADQFPADGAGGGGFDNNADTLFLPPVLMEQYLRAASDVLNAAPPERAFTARPGESLDARSAARKVIETFATRAFRRPVKTDDVERYLKLYDRGHARGEGYEDAVKLALKGVMVSPQFLYRTEQDQPTDEPYAVNDYELASRLSYFLWSSMPDEELTRLAGEGKLHEDAVLEAQVRRMLADPKSRSMAEQFGVQWLGIDEIKGTIQPDRRRFPQFTPAVRDAMFDEAVAFVDSVFREDRGLPTLLDANYTFVNEDLANLYGIDGVKGQELRRVTLPDGQRGGLLGLGAVLTVTSYPQRTSPVLRGRWVLDTVLGAPPPPPPPNVPSLSADDKVINGLTFRQRLELHRKKPECASCHDRMDPLGFGLENFDPIGRWRTELAGQPVDAGGVLNTGETFAGPAALKGVLLSKRDEFARNLAEKMLSYALGRGLEYYDRPAVRRLTDALARNGYRSSVLFVEVARSFPFRYRRNDPIAAAGAGGE
jgi:hypothetical protein